MVSEVSVVIEHFLYAGMGVIAENGAGADRYRVGQRVTGAPWPWFLGNGSWQQYVVLPEQVQRPGKL